MATQGWIESSMREKVRMTPIEDKIRKNGLRSFCHVKRRIVDAPMRIYEQINHLECRRDRGRPNKSYDLG